MQKNRKNRQDIFFISKSSFNSISFSLPKKPPDPIKNYSIGYSGFQAILHIEKCPACRTGRQGHIIPKKIFLILSIDFCD
jgi:hypothetical protein